MVNPGADCRCVEAIGWNVEAGRSQEVEEHVQIPRSVVSTFRWIHHHHIHCHAVWEDVLAHERIGPRYRRCPHPTGRHRWFACVAVHTTKVRVDEPAGCHHTGHFLLYDPAVRMPWFRLPRKDKVRRTNQSRRDVRAGRLFW